MKNIMILIIATLLFVACSKDNEYEILISEDNIEAHQKIFDDVSKYIGEYNSIDIKTTIDYLKTLEGVTNVLVEDSIIRVTTQGDVQFSIDCNTYPDYELGNLNLNKLQNYLDSIENVIGGIASGYEQTSEVFKEYISNNGSNNNNASTTITRASSQAQVRLARRNFVIWSPYNRSDFTKEKNDVMSIVKKKTNLCAQTTRFSPASFTDLAAFDVVYMSSHGCKDGSFFLPAEYLSSTDIDEYEKEIAAKRAEKSIRRIGDKRVKGYSLKKTFFDKYLSDLGHTVIYTSACYFGADNSLFMKCCKDKNVADYFGSDNACIGADVLNAFSEFYPKLMNGYSTKMAFKNGRSSFTGSLLRGKTLETYKFKRFGDKQVSYVMPHATGTGNRSNASKAQTRSDGSDASSIVVNAQLRYATEESGDILKSIEAGICLQDMETKEVKLIPFSNKNMVSNEKKSHGNVTVSNIAVSLDDLADGHKYAYCCYAKVDGQITLSDECYPISENYYLKIHYKNHNISHHYYQKCWCKDGDILEWDYDLTPDDDFESYFRIAKINGKYYIDLSGLPQQLYTDNSLVDYPYSGGDDSYDGHGKAQCMMDNNTIHLDWSYTWKEPFYYDLGDGAYAKGYRIISHEEGIEINNLNSDLKASWSDEISTYEHYTLAASYWEGMRTIKEYLKYVLISNNTFLYFEKSDIPSEDLLNWEKRKKYWCELVDGTKKQTN